MMSYSLAINEDWKTISNLLNQAALPTDDVKINMHHFIVAKTGNIVIGCIGSKITQPLAYFVPLQ